MNKFMIAAVAGLLTLSACTNTAEPYNNTVVENVQDPDTRGGPCGDGSIPKRDEVCK